MSVWELTVGLICLSIMLTPQALVSHPIPDNEFERLLEMSNYDIDFSNLEHQFKDLTKLVKIAGTEISLVNLIDFTQWSVAAHGFPVSQVDRSDSICQYTIMGEQPFEVNDFSEDERFHENPFRPMDPNSGIIGEFL